MGDEFDDGEYTTQQITPVPPQAPEGRREHGMLHVLAGPHNGSIFTLDQPVVTLGRGSDCQVFLVDQGISRTHARIFRGEDGFYLEDAGSRNGTFCQRQKVEGRRKLADGDRIAVGAETVMRFSLQDRVESQAARQTVELMIRDPLTQVLNRRQLDERLQTELAFARRHGSPLFVLLVDLDHFKQINDQYGHQAGDRTLRAVARALERTLRVEDVIGRYGGEEFGIGVRGVPREGIAVLAERLRRTIEQLGIRHRDRAIPVTISVGVAELAPQHETVAELIQAADRALYEAKRLGRNRVVMD
ncbi:MAG: GGDEF domain-containing protein [Myxococcales bacterium]|jgi:diguanylate cyclase (GGDEF)-like protein